MDFKTELKLAESAAREAGRLLAGRTDRRVLVSEGHDVKLELDRISEELICAKLARGSNFPILGEESGLSAALEPGCPFWIVDPLDGSLNFSQGIPLCCVSIALWCGNTPVLGVVYDFNRDEMISGLLAHGVYLNGAPVRRPKGRSVADSILATGFPSYLLHDEQNLQRVIWDIRRYKKIRLLGSAALSLAYVALGRVNAYFEDSIKLWDIAAGLAICSEFGFATELIELDPAQFLYRVTVDNVLV